MLGIQEQFWDTYYPEVEDGDLESRSGPFIFLNSVITPLIRSLPLTHGFGEEQYSYFRWQESRATDNAGLKSQEMKDALIAEGKITGEQFDDAVAQTPRRFYEALVEDLIQCIEAVKSLDESMDQRLGRDSPGVVSVRKALAECRTVLEPILNNKRLLEPDPEDESESVGVLESGEAAETEEADYEEAQAVATAPGTAPSRGLWSSGGPISSVDDAHQRIVEATAYLREHDPASPVPYLVNRALRMGGLYGQPEQPPDISACEAPSSEVRVSLRRLRRKASRRSFWKKRNRRSAAPKERPGSTLTAMRS